MPPFSNKKKKEQLQKKRQLKKERADDPNSFYKSIMSKTHFGGKPVKHGESQQNGKQEETRGRQKFAELQFFKDTDQELKMGKELSYLPIKPVSEQDKVVKATNPACLDIPKRPPWNKSFSKEHLERYEQTYFKEFVDALVEKAKESGQKLSYFDLNLDTWRQLWRVIEMSEIVTIIVDIRHPIFHFPLTLYKYIVEEHKKMVIIVLNKIDLVPASLVLAWQQYLKEFYPEIRIVPFASYAGMKKKANGKRVGLLHMAIEGANRFMMEVEALVGSDRIDFSGWKKKIQDELAWYKNRDNQVHDDSDDDSDEDIEKAKKKIDEPSSDEETKAFKRMSIQDHDTSLYSEEKYKDGVLTLGFVGHPNVGKSSFMNALLGKKLVSVSRTPGHTKHFQTIFLTPNIKLCDCPGLVFPSYYPKPLQVLMGCYPISQLREPYSSITYLAERIDVLGILKLVLNSKIRKQALNMKDSLETVKDDEWSAFDICESWAAFKHFETARSGRPDAYRAANHLLRMALDGRTLCLAFYPPNYLSKQDEWSNHEQVKEMEIIQGCQNLIKEMTY